MMLIIVMIFSATRFGIDCWWDVASMLAPCWVRFDVFKCLSAIDCLIISWMVFSWFVLESDRTWIPILFPFSICFWKCCLHWVLMEFGSMLAPSREQVGTIVYDCWLNGSRSIFQFLMFQFGILQCCKCHYKSFTPPIFLHLFIFDFLNF